MSQDKPTTESKLITVAVPRDIANRLRVVAAHRDITMTEALDKLFRPIIDREYRKCVRAANGELGGEG